METDPTKTSPQSLLPELPNSTGSDLPDIMEFTQEVMLALQPELYRMAVKKERHFGEDRADNRLADWLCSLQLFYK